MRVEANTSARTAITVYNNHKKALAKKYYVQPKGSALRLKGCGPENLGVDFHNDVVLGRFTDETRTDAYLYQSGGDKTRLKTNLDVHLDYVRLVVGCASSPLPRAWRAAYPLTTNLTAVYSGYLRGMKLWKLRVKTRQLPKMASVLRG